MVKYAISYIGHWKIHDNSDIFLSLHTKRPKHHIPIRVAKTGFELHSYMHERFFCPSHVWIEFRCISLCTSSRLCKSNKMNGMAVGSSLVIQKATHGIHNVWGAVGLLGTWGSDDDDDDWFACCLYGLTHAYIQQSGSGNFVCRETGHT